jgi:hypothetical protein
MRDRLRDRLLTLLIVVAALLGGWVFLEAGQSRAEEKALRMQVTLDSLRHVNHDQNLYIMQLEYETESLGDALSDCTEDFQNCIAGRKIQIRHIDGNIPITNPDL